MHRLRFRLRTLLLLISLFGVLFAAMAIRARTLNRTSNHRKQLIEKYSLSNFRSRNELQKLRDLKGYNFDSLICYLFGIEPMNYEERLRVDDLTLMKRMNEITTITEVGFYEADTVNLGLFVSNDQIRSVEIRDCHPLKRLDGLGPLKNLERLQLESCDNLESLFGLSEVASSLKHLDLDCSLLNVKDLEELSSLRNLETLDIDLANRAVFEEICKLPNLRRLNIWSNVGHQIDNLESIRKLKSLVRLDLDLSNDRGQVMEIENLNGFDSLDNLRVLRLSGARGLKDVSALNRLKGLELLELESLELEQLDLDLPNLRILSLRSCKNLQSIDFLSNCKKLEGIDIGNCSSLSDMEVLRQLPLLRQIYARSCPKLKLSKPFPVDFEFYSGPDRGLDSLDFEKFLE